MSVNSTTISGNLGRDAELRTTQSGTAVLRFGVAVSERVKQQDGSWGDRANWIDCVLFGKRGEAVAQYLAKGTHVTVQGHLRQSTWEKDGQRRSKLELIVNELDFTGAQRPQVGYQQPGYAAPAPAPAPTPQAPPVQTPPSADVYDEDIPF